MTILFYGPSGSGKDTQAELLENRFKRVSSGDLIRDICVGDREIQKIIQQQMNEGFLPEMFSVGLTQIYLAELSNEKIILSGAVRTSDQVEMMDLALERIGRKMDLVVYFKLDDETATGRMTGRLHCANCGNNYHKIFNPPTRVDRCDECGSILDQRKDDNDEGIKNRLREFHKYNDAILEKYEARNNLITIDASKSIEEIHKEVQSYINDKL